MAPGPTRPRRRLVVPWWSVPIAVVAVLGAAEAFAAAVGPNISRQSGSEERAFIKADQMYSRSGPTDIAIIGSSETGAGLVPSIVEAQVPPLSGAYNAALVGATLPMLDEWADRVVLPTLDPEVVVIGMLPTAVLDYSAAEVDPAPGVAEAYASAFDQIDPGGLGSISWALRQHSALIRYRPYLRSPSATWDGIRTTLDGGADAPEVTPRTMDARTETDPAVVAALTGDDGEILEYRDPGVEGLGNRDAVLAFTAASSLPVDFGPLEALFDTIEASGATPVLALAPIDRRVLERDGADLSGLDELNDRIIEFATAQGVPVTSNFDSSWPADWFNDRQHVSAKGAKAWSTDVGEFLDAACEEGTLGTAC